jgi:hypothetical protein
MSVLTNVYFLIPTIALVVQIIVLALLIYGYWLYRQFTFPRHGRIMTWALVLHLIVIFTIMVPSFVLAVIPEYIVRNTLQIISIITLIHVPLGITAASFGTWFVIAWRLKGLKGCFNRRKLMLLAFILWLASLSFGILLYSIFYWSILTG